MLEFFHYTLVWLLWAFCTMHGNENLGMAKHKRDTLFHANLLKFIEENNPWIKTKFTKYLKSHSSSCGDFLSVLFVFVTAKIDKNAFQ